MTDYEMPKNCPNCRNHCSIDLLRCARGRQWKMIMMSKVNESKQSKKDIIEEKKLEYEGD